MKSPFMMFEHVHFYFGQDADLTEMVEIAKKHEVITLLDDIALLIEGDVSHPRYSYAFNRGLAHYQGFSSEKLFEYYNYLAETFDAQAPSCPIVKRHQKNFERLY